MFEPQRFMDLEENAGFGDPKSWLTGDGHSSPSHPGTQSSLSGAGRNVDRVLFNDLVEIVPLVQSLIDRKASSSFTRRGSMVYTKTPSRESYSKKINEVKGRNAAQSIPINKRHGDKDQGKKANNTNEASVDNFSNFSRSLGSEKDKEELISLREQLEDLQRKLVEKDELLKSAELSKNQMTAIQSKLDEMKLQAAEKDSLIKTTQLQFTDAKIKLADKQAALEKMQWEAMTSNRKAEKLEKDLDSIQGEISSFMLLIEGLTKNNPAMHAEDYDVLPYHMDHLPQMDDIDDMEMQKMEEAREAYIAAVNVAKEKQDEESLAAAANARLRLQSFVLGTKTLNPNQGSPQVGISRAPIEAFVH